MTPEQQKSCIYAFNTLEGIVRTRVFFNTNARVDLVSCFRIIDALLQEDLLSIERCVEFDRHVATLSWQLERPYFSKFRGPLFGALHGLSSKARMTLFRKLRKHIEETSSLSGLLFGNSGTDERDRATYIELFVKRYGGEEQMYRLLPFA